MSDARADALENLQDVLGEGPGMDAFDSGEVVRTALDRLAEARWPQFVPAAAADVGRDGLLWAIPMRSDGQVIGAVMLYRLRPGCPGEPVLDAQFLAEWPP